MAFQPGALAGRLPFAGLFAGEGCSVDPASGEAVGADGERAGVEAFSGGQVPDVVFDGLCEGMESGDR